MINTNKVTFADSANSDPYPTSRVIPFLVFFFRLSLSANTQDLSPFIDGFVKVAHLLN